MSDDEPEDSGFNSAVDRDLAERGDRLRAATPTGRHLFALLSRSGTLEALYEVGMNGPVRFNELKQRLDISSATLSARLSELVDAGLVRRTSYDESPPRVEYTRTEKLADLKPILLHFIDWAEDHRLELDDETAEEWSSSDT